MGNYVTTDICPQICAGTGMDRTNLADGVPAELSDFWKRPQPTLLQTCNTLTR